MRILKLYGLYPSRFSAYDLIVDRAVLKGGVVMDIRPELRQFASASEVLLSYRVDQAALTEEEQYLVQYYLETIAEKFPTPH